MSVAHISSESVKHKLDTDGECICPLRRDWITRDLEELVANWLHWYFIGFSDLDGFYPPVPAVLRVREGLHDYCRGYHAHQR